MHMKLANEPQLAKSVFMAEGCKVLGNVEIGEHSSVWYNSVIRGDLAKIKIGKCTNVQDLVVVHVDRKSVV